VLAQRKGVAAAQASVTEGHDWVVDIDLEQFFDRVNHDILMSRVAQRVSDKRVLRLIRAYLSAWVMENGLVSATTRGRRKAARCRPCCRTCSSPVLPVRGRLQH
jgi:RNA-directed DNA polymerase